MVTHHFDKVHHFVTEPGMVSWLCTAGKQRLWGLAMIGLCPEHETAGKRAGVLAVFHERFAVDKGVRLTGAA